jgi:small subunit ribosomal protein S1
MASVQAREEQPVDGDGESFEELFEQYMQSEPVIQGEIVKGIVLNVGSDFVTVDVGYKSEGQISIDEFFRDGVLEVNEGDEIEVYVENLENDAGLVELSKEKAQKLKIWDEISDACERDELVEGVIVSRVKGGLTVDIGVKAFLPGSQVDLRPVRNLEKYLGERYQFRVIKFNKKRGNIVLSRRVLLEKERESMKSATLETLEVGIVVKGVVKNITDYGCFVDLGGIDGLLHITDMSWGRVNHPSEMFEVGTELDVKVLKFDSETERVSLGLKQITEDPWLVIAETHSVGQRVSGKVVSLTDYGAFIEIADGVEGLIHVSEMSWTKRVKHPSRLLEEGEAVEAVILDIDTENKRISLGLKQTEENPWVALEERYPIGSTVRGKVRNITNFGIFVGIEEGIDGLVHISDLSWSPKIKHPQEMFEKSDEVMAMVLHIDPDKERFSLGIKQLQKDPWEDIDNRYPLGCVIEGVVTKILDFGAIVQLDEAVEGLIHISELSEDMVETVGSVVNEGDTVRTKVINLIPEERKIGLSMKRLSVEESAADYEAMQAAYSAPTTRFADLLKDVQLDGGEEAAEEAPAEEAAEEAPAEEVVEEAVEAPAEEAAEEAPAEEAAEEAPAEEVVEEAAEEAPVEEAAEEAAEEAEEAAEEAPVEEAAEEAAEEAEEAAEETDKK